MHFFVMIFDTNLDPILYVLRHICFEVFCKSIFAHAQFIQSFFGSNKRGWFSKALHSASSLFATQEFCAANSAELACIFRTHIIFFDSLWLKIPQKRKWLERYAMTCYLIYHVLLSFLYCFQAFKTCFLLTAPFNFLSNHDVNLVCQVLLFPIKICN